MATYLEREQGIATGDPVELYLFQAAGETWRVTSSEESFTLDGETFTPLAIGRGAIAQSQEQRSNTLKITIPANHEIAQRFTPFIPNTPMTLVIYRTHRGLDDSEAIMYWNGRVTAALLGDSCDLTCESDAAGLKKRIPGARYQRPCNRILFDVGCGVDPDDFKVETELTGVSPDFSILTSPDFDAKPDGWFRNGYVEFGQQLRMIIDHTGPDLTLLGPLFGAEIGSEVTAFAGCARTLEECVAKFDNGARFLGFPWMPSRNPFQRIE